LWLEPRRLAGRYALGLGWFLVAAAREVATSDEKRRKEAMLF